MFASHATSSSSGSSSHSSGSSWTSPSSSTRSSPVHAGSLVDPATHAPALLELIDIKLDRHVIDYVVDCVSETVDHAMRRTVPSRPSRTYLPKFHTLVSTVLSRAEVTAPTLLVSLVYIQRARPHLCISLEEWALERVFLGALICASKYANDSTLKNAHWALCTGVFGNKDVGRIEREFLDVLDWELGVREADLLAHHEGLIAASRRSAALASRTKVSLKRAAPTYLEPQRPHPHPPHGHARRSSMPELDPSSPQSSLASMSPRTPSNFPHSPADLPHPYHDMSLSLSQRYHPAPHAASKGGKWRDMMRSFPLPRHHAQTRRHAHAQGGYAIRVAA
ncbi:hypothetical protein B0H13DRAFT_2086678 [Mycena leptocephala]|nr:hypothetical protein B0H13DRAFT_2086678 [Mycena leptocephala]